MRHPIVRSTGLLLLFFTLAGAGHGQPLVWLDSLETARTTALGQRKLLLLVAGSLTCPDCVYVKEQVCESAAVRPIIDEACVPWFTDIYWTTDWQPYAEGLPYFAMPLACVIDPQTTNAWIARRTGLCSATTFQNYLLGALRSHPPQPSNLVNQQVIGNRDYQVTGHMWPNTQPTGVSYRVTLGTNAAGLFVSASGTTDWVAALAPFVVTGVSNQYAFEVYAKFDDGSQSPTNRLVFNYHPTVTPPLLPEITWISMSNRVVNLTLTNLAIGVRVQLERSLHLGPTDQWCQVTNFVSTACTSEVAEEIDPAWGRAFYRASAAP